MARVRNHSSDRRSGPGPGAAVDSGPNPGPGPDIGTNPSPGLADRLAAWRAGFHRPGAGFVRPPAPGAIGMLARGRQLVAGTYLLGGVEIRDSTAPPWAAPIRDADFLAAAHGFGWLDDLAALGDVPAIALARRWLADWIARHGRGRGPGWTPALTGQRLARWIDHGGLLLDPDDLAHQRAVLAALMRQAHYLARRWSAAPAGLPRFAALHGLIAAAAALHGAGRLLPAALRGIEAECDRAIAADGSIASRNPEELLDILVILAAIARIMAETGQRVPAGIAGAVERLVPVLRALRHADGGLARFHGGGRGLDGRLDRALADSGVKPAAVTGPAMGYARLAAGRTTVIVDVESPPGGAAALTAHAATLAFELTSGRRPVIVSCGSGAPFGAEWRRAGRATASHSTLAIAGYSSSRLGQGERLDDRAAVVAARLTHGAAGQAVVAGHHGWAETHGLTHLRALELAADGRRLAGQDTLGAQDGAGRRRLAAVLAAGRQQGIAFALRFHLHPDVDAELDLGGTAVSLGLPSGEIWIFRHDGTGRLALEPSVYLEKGRLQPRPTRQIVLSARIRDYAVELGWTLAKAQDTPLAIRDLERVDTPI